MGVILAGCCDRSKQQPQSALQQGHMLKVQMDYAYFAKQDWFGIDKQFFNPEKFIFYYHGYKEDQEHMERFWAKADIDQIRHGELTRYKGQVLNKKWQYLIRKGVPSRLSKTIILDIFRLTYVDCEQEYISALKIVFKNKPIPKTFRHIPLFGSQTQDDDDEEFEYMNECERKLQLILKLSILNQNGIEALSRLLWVINGLYHQMEYNPMLVHIITLLLIYLSEAQVYCVLSFMIKDSFQCQDQENLRWHLILNEDQFQEIATSCYNTLSQRSATFGLLFNKMKQLNFNYIELFQELSISLMLTYFPFSVALKVFIIYLNEGIKIYFRFFYAMIRYVKNDIIQVQTNSLLKSTIRKKILNLDRESYDDIIKQAFKLRLNYATKGDKNAAKVSYIKTQPCYLPIPSQDSDLINSEQFEVIWDWLPGVQKLTDPNLIFSTKFDGYSLKYLYQKCQPYKEYSSLLILRAENVTLGFYGDVMFDPLHKYIGGNECFIFTLYPIIKCYQATGNNQEFLLCTNDYFCIGSGKNGPAIQLDQDLNKGYTNSSETFNNPQFDSKFRCLALELYYLK